MTTPEDELEGALCRIEVRAGHAPVHDPRTDAEKSKEVGERHAKARAMCHQCPVLDACEQRLVAYEEAGVRIGGVVAGRYSIVRAPGPKSGEEQSQCIACAAPLVIRGRMTQSADARRHAGEGLCELCWPRMNRKARRQR